MKTILIFLTLAFASCTASKVNKPGMYQVTGIVKESPGITTVKLNGSKRWYRIYSDAQSDTLKLGDSLKLNIITATKY